MRILCLLVLLSPYAILVGELWEAALKAHRNLWTLDKKRFAEREAYYQRPLFTHNSKEGK